MRLGNERGRVEMGILVENWISARVIEGILAHLLIKDLQNPSIAGNPHKRVLLDFSLRGKLMNWFVRDAVKLIRLAWR